jgi:hypothetical protein
MTATSDHELICHIDAAGTVIEVNDQWHEFSRENQLAGAPSLSSVGRPFWDHMGNRTIVHFLLALVAKVRRTGREIAVPFRLNTPQKRRQLELRLLRKPAGMVEFRWRIQREERLDARSKKPWENLWPRYSDDLIRMCSWCKRVAAPDWVEVDEAVRRLKLFESDPIPRVTHTICETCAEAVRREIRAL